MAESDLPSEGNNQPKPKKASKSAVPAADANFDTTVHDVATSWLGDPDITLKWIAQAQFKVKADLYSTALGNRQGTGALRPSLTSDLTSVDKKLDEGIDNLKSYLIGDFNKKASVHYAKFGIEKNSSGAYLLPKDRDKRQKALKLLLPAIANQGYDAKQYGKDYFTPLIAEFNRLYSDAKSSDGNVSGHVSDKNVLKVELTKVLRSLIKVLEGNYPDTFKAVLRQWGFQKEKY